MIAWQAGERPPCQCGVEDQLGVIGGELPLDAHVQRVAVFLEFPGIEPTQCRQAQVYAVVIDEVARRLRAAMGVEIARRRSDTHPQIRADPHRDHVLLDALAQTDARVIAFAGKLHEALFGNKLDVDGGMFGHDPLRHRQKDVSGRTTRRGQADRACGPLAQRIDVIETRVNVVEGRPERLRQACPGIGGRVVRVRRRISSRSSSRRTTWLSALCDVPSLAAARVKLRSSATTRNAMRSPRSSRLMVLSAPSGLGSREIYECLI